MARMVFVYIQGFDDSHRGPAGERGVDWSVGEVSRSMNIH